MSKICLKCGEMIEDEKIAFCPKCGTKIGEAGIANKEEYKSGLLMASWILMIITTVVTGWLLVPLAWNIPFTIKIKKRMDRGEKLSTGFKVCCLIFGNLISGILLLCDSEA